LVLWNFTGKANQIKRMTSIYVVEKDSSVILVSLCIGQGLMSGGLQGLLKIATPQCLQQNLGIPFCIKHYL
jgi:hypothetical protein